jgi:nicotinate phosphoribosyltransferase
MNITSDALLTDLYELTMAQAYLAQGMTDIAVFEFFVRKLPPQRNFFMAAGLEQVLSYLEAFQFSDADIAWLDQTGGFSPASLTRSARCALPARSTRCRRGASFFRTSRFSA